MSQEMEKASIAMKTKTMILAGVLAATLASAGSAQTSVDQRRAAEADGTVEIENPAGTIHVVGWDRNEVAVMRCSSSVPPAVT